ncbi:MAG: hypothetical protein IT453_09550 [Planctomycetes bacterium]|nr:hypothetical protein [Planctomycetota bacterium]
MLRSMLAALLLAAAALAQSPTHTATLATKHFDVRYEPGSRAGAFVEREAARAERDHAEICEALGIEPKGRYQLFLYDDVADLSATTGTSGTGGFSAEDQSHVPVNNDQTRFHELVHIIAYGRLQKAGSEPRNLFFAEGLANALLEHVHGVPVHSVARFYLDRDALPPLAEMTGAADFYAWLGARSGFNAYDVAGSYLRFLLDTYGAKKTTRYYMGASASVAFGVDEAKVEKAWREALARFELRPEVAALLEERHGASVTMMLDLARPPGLPPELLGSPKDWTSLLDRALAPQNGAEWKRVKDGIVGKSPLGEWSICELGTELYGDCVVRAKIHTSQPSPLMLRLSAANQALLVNGTFVYRNGESHAFSQLASMDGARRQTDFVFVRRAGKLEIWIDERRVLSTDADATPSTVGIGFHQGEVRFEDVRVRRL